MPFSLEVATQLVGRARALYQCNHVVNEVLNQNRNKGGLARDYLHYGKPVGAPSAGTVVVGNDGVHVGIFISQTEFIHSSVSRQQVVRAGVAQLKYVFPMGYQLRK